MHPGLPKLQASLNLVLTYDPVHFDFDLFFFPLRGERNFFFFFF